MEDTNEKNVPEGNEELEQVKQRYLYLSAEFENYKRRYEKERGLWIDHAEDAVLKNVLPVVDDMERALQEIKGQEVSEELASHIAGFEMIAKGLSKLLAQYDIEEIPFSKEFDPELYDAVMCVKVEDHESGQVIETFKKGYTRKGRVLQPAQVSVAE